MIDNNMERGNSKLAFKVGFWYVCANFVGKAISFITTPIFARMMSASDYGDFSNFATWVTSLTIIFGAELYNTLNRAYYDFKEEYNEYIFSVTVLGSFFIAAGYIIFWIERSFFLDIVKIQEKYVHILFITIMFLFFRLMYYARERVFYRYKTVAFITFLNLLVPTIISVFVLYLLPESNYLSARIYGFYIPSTLIGVFCVAPLLKKGKCFKWRYCKYALILSIPLLVHYLAANLLISANIMVARNILGAEAAAVISLASSATHVLSLLFTSTSGALTTWLMDNLYLDNVNTAKKGTLLYIIFLASITVLVILLAPELIYFLGGEKYAASIIFLPGFLFAILIHSIATIFNIILTYDKNVFFTAFCTSVFSLLSVIAKIYLVPDYGLMALVYVNIVIFSILFFANYLLVKAAGYAKVISLEGLIAVIFIVGLLTFSSMRIYQLSSVRYIIAGIFLVCSMIITTYNKSQLKRFIFNLRK